MVDDSWMGHFGCQTKLKTGEKCKLYSCGPEIRIPLVLPLFSDIFLYYFEDWFGKKYGRASPLASLALALISSNIAARSECKKVDDGGPKVFKFRFSIKIPNIALFISKN